MPEIKFNINNDDLDRLFSIKKKQKLNNLTGNEFAKLLLENKLYQLHPSKVQYDENGMEI